MADTKNTPWTRGNTSPDMFMLLDASGRYCGHVQITQTGGGSIAAADEDRRTECGHTILKRVNAHDDLVKALEAALATHGDQYSWGPIARDALAKAAS
jgi:hypothetical protein